MRTGHLDSFEQAHLAAWLRNTLQKEDWHKAALDIQAYCLENPEVLNTHSWPEILSLATV